ncbi:hypothetical protein ACOMHN_021240 [Nucella lapillus]
MKDVLPKPPIVGQRIGRTLRNSLMPSVLPTPDDSHPSSVRCFNMGPDSTDSDGVTEGQGQGTGWCIICTNHLVETKIFHSDTIGETFRLRHRVSCTTKNIIYMLFCDKCAHVQYVGETKNMLKTRFYLHRSHIGKNVGTLVTRHFNLPNHTVNNMRCLPIERVYTDSLRYCRARENFWINKLQTRVPLGLITLDS